MLLRRITEHINSQNWTAVVLDLAVVVIGVIIGMQVSNWNEERALREYESNLLVELRGEIEKSISIASGRAVYFDGVATAGRRSLEFIEANQACAEKCWRRLVDFFHASQWSDVAVARSAYAELRRLGLPKSRSVSEAVEAFYAHNDSLARVLGERPTYRTLVRGLIPLSAHSTLWLECHASENGIERLIPDCEPGIPTAQARQRIKLIRNHQEISPALTLWTGTLVLAPPYLAEQNELAKLAIAAIDDELKKPS